MIWCLTSSRQALAANRFVRLWLRSAMLDRFVYIFVPATFWSSFWFSAGLGTGSLLGFEICFLGIGGLPWAFWFADSVLLNAVVLTDSVRLGRVRQASRLSFCEYVGGHPQLPQSRFAYLLLDGTIESPSVTILAGRHAAPAFPMPLLDCSI